MRLWVQCAALGIFASAIVSVNPVSVRAQDMHMAHCPTFTATTWHNEQNGKTGNTFGISLTNVKMSCGDAIALAKKLMTPPIPGDFASPYAVKGGPAGYHCYITADGKGHAWGGTCHTEGGSSVSSIDWGPITK
jgi:hypothetical protein